MYKHTCLHFPLPWTTFLKSSLGGFSDIALAAACCVCLKQRDAISLKEYTPQKRIWTNSNTTFAYLNWWCDSLLDKAPLGMLSKKEFVMYLSKVFLEWKVISGFSIHKGVEWTLVKPLRILPH